MNQWEKDCIFMSVILKIKAYVRNFQRIVLPERGLR